MVNEGVKFVKDVISTFSDQTFLTNTQIELGWLQLEEKGIMGTKPIASGSQFWSLTTGEWAVLRAGIGNIVITRLDEKGIDLKELTMQVGQDIIDLTNGYYFNYIKGKPRQYVYDITKKTIKKMLDWNLIDFANEKYKRHTIDSVEFIANFYGNSFNCPTGKSSFYRMMIGALPGETPGIQEDFVCERLANIHKVSKITKEHLARTLNIHGSAGTGYILKDISGCLYRAYDRIDQIPSNAPSVFQDNPKLLDLIAKTPVVSQKIIYEIFGGEISKRLFEETETIKPSIANKIVVRRNDTYLLGIHIKAMKLRNCDPDNNPALTIVKDLYSQFNPQDCVVVAFLARDLIRELNHTGEYTPEIDKERRILTFLENRNIVERDVFGDKFRVKNQQLVKHLSVVLKNLLD